MDQKDEKILEILKEDGRASYTEIAEEIDVSEGTVRNRVQKMKDEGVIERFSVDVADYSISAIIMAKLDTSVNPEKVLNKFPGGLTVYEVTGEHDMIIKAEGSKNEEINDIVDEIRGIEGVKDTVTRSVLKETRT